ncbi:MAG: hypothetical protein PVF43_12085 [Candidatus Eiseniibacteriota bacterium]
MQVAFRPQHRTLALQAGARPVLLADTCHAERQLAIAPGRLRDTQAQAVATDPMASDRTGRSLH